MVQEPNNFPGVVKNGPPRRMRERIELVAGTEHECNGYHRRRFGVVDLSPGFCKAGAALNKDATVRRESEQVRVTGQPVIMLGDPNATQWVMSVLA